ncbi:8911_t:CDS:1, partial [Cetraspora pellucida]
HHYNQIVAKNSFINQLKKADEQVSVDSGESAKKRLKLSNVDELQLDSSKKTFANFGVQVNLLEKTSVDFGLQ